MLKQRHSKTIPGIDVNSLFGGKSKKNEDEDDLPELEDYLKQHINDNDEDSDDENERKKRKISSPTITTTTSVIDTNQLLKQFSF